MKNITLSLLTIATLFTACNNEGKNKQVENNPNGTETVEGKVNTDEIGIISFKENEFDFGTIKEGEIIKHTFTFTNTGKSPVILSQVSASCGCTTPTYTSEPVLPGKDGEIVVEFKSAGQVGQQQKIITIASNAESNIMTVQLRGTVTPK